MYCQICGNKTKEDSKFCSSCGEEIKTISTEVEQNTKIKKSIKRIPLITIPIVFVLVASIILPAGNDPVSDRRDYFLGQIFGFSFVILLILDLIRYYRHTKKKKIICSECSAFITKEYAFCVNCGQKVEDKNKTKLEKFFDHFNKKPQLPESPQKLFWTLIGTVVGGVLGWYMGLPAIILILGWAIGVLLGRSLSKKKTPNATLVKIIGWSCVVTWTMPIVGILTGSMIIEYIKFHSETPKKYKIIAIICIILAILNSLSYIVLKRMGYI